MADFNALETLINAHIKKNGVQAITGNILNGILRGMVSALGKGYTIAGSASPATDPGTMTGPLAYIAYTAGTYTHFGGLEVEQGEVAMLIYNEAEWHKEVLFSLSATATIDGNVGTPEVGVSFVDGLLTFDFRNMKGNPGNDGDAAGFGTISATVDGNIGTPGVSVQSSGPDTAKNITFQFTNLKGETGVTSVVATVDNTVGTPTCTVSLVGQQLTLAFSGLKGAQGDTGSSVDYPFTIVNNLTTNDATQALSAAMGVELAGQVSQLELEVDELAEEVQAINPHITGRMGIGNTNEDVNPSDLQLYTGQYGIVTLLFNEDGYLCCCLENDNFRVSAHGVEVPMNYVKEDGDLHCFVSAEKIKAGVMQFVVEGIHPIKADSERVIITARSYTITYGDEMPDFGFIADGEVEGTPAITCEAVQGSDVGTYAISIARGTVQDDNAIYVPGTLTIVKAELVITADNKQVAVGGSMPALTVSYEGFVLGEDASVLTTLPTCTTTAEDTDTEGNYPITPSGAVATNYAFEYVAGVLRVGEPILASFSPAEVFAGGNLGGYINLPTAANNPNKWNKDSQNRWYGTLVDVRNFKGCTLRIKYVDTMSINSTRFAFLTAPTYSNGATPSYVDGVTGVTIYNFVEEGTDHLDVVVPNDAEYLYLYIYSTGDCAPGLDFYAPSPTVVLKDMDASLFHTKTTVGPNGTVYTGSQAETVVCSDYLDASEYAILKNLTFRANNYPSGVTDYFVAVAEYDGNKKFIRRLGYDYIPYKFEPTPSTAYIRVMVVCEDNGTQLSGGTIRFDNDDIQTEGQ